MTTFTSEEFKDYLFNCETTGANVGFKHICHVMKDNEEVCKTEINWGNRTWESYQYERVFEGAKSKLASLIENNFEEPKQEIDYGFLNTLANYEYIYDYAEDKYGDTCIMVDTWSQVEEGSVWNKLVELAKKDMLKPSINKTMLALEDEYVFTDEYTKCSECGKLLNMTYGEGTFIDSAYDCGYYCNDCINNDSEIIKYLVEKAKEDFYKSVPVEISTETIQEMGYEAVQDQTYFSFDSGNWTADTHITQEKAKAMCDIFGGFIKLGAVQQFDTLFHIFVPKDRVLEANSVLRHS